MRRYILTAIVATVLGGASAFAAEQVVTSPPTLTTEDARPVHLILEASKELRRVVDTLEPRQSSPERRTAIRASLNALIDAQQAIANVVPPRSVIANDRANDDKVSIDRLKGAAEHLRQAAQEFADNTDGPGKIVYSTAIKKVNDALFETQQAMAAITALPPRQQAAAKPGDREAGTGAPADRSSREGKPGSLTK